MLICKHCFEEIRKGQRGWVHVGGQKNHNAELLPERGPIPIELFKRAKFTAWRSTS